MHASVLKCRYHLHQREGNSEPRCVCFIMVMDHVTRLYFNVFFNTFFNVLFYFNVQTITFYYCLLNSVDMKTVQLK